MDLTHFFFFQVEKLQTVGINILVPFISMSFNMFMTVGLRQISASLCVIGTN